MNQDTRQADLISKNYTAQIADKDSDSFAVEILFGCIVAAMALAIVLAIVAIRGMCA